MQAGGGENQGPTKLDSPIRPSVKHIIYRVFFSLVSPRKVLSMELVPPNSEK